MTLAEAALPRWGQHAQDRIVVSFPKARFVQVESGEPMADAVRLRSVSTWKVRPLALRARPPARKARVPLVKPDSLDTLLKMPDSLRS